MTTSFQVGDVRIGSGDLFLIAGPCVIESEEHAIRMAEIIKGVTRRSAFLSSSKPATTKPTALRFAVFAGPGLKEGLRILKKIKDEFQLPVLTDVHEVADVAKVAEVVDVLQIPAFLCRQTDLVVAAALSGAPVNIKKGQFVSPWDMRHAVEKCREAGNTQVFLTERGTSFGYNNLVVDMRSLAIMRKFAPVVFDATHSVQLPSAQADERARGQRRPARVHSGSGARSGRGRCGWRFPGSPRQSEGSEIRRSECAGIDQAARSAERIAGREKALDVARATP